MTFSIYLTLVLTSYMYAYLDHLESKVVSHHRCAELEGPVNY